MKTNPLFETSNIYLAAFLLVNSIPLGDVDRSDSHHVRFIFSESPDEELIVGYWRGDAQVPDIGIDTIFLSKGSIPEVFLRGAGVPDDLIDYMTSLVSKPYYSCVVCYSDEDRDFSDRLYADLRTNGVRAWYFRKDARWGEPTWGEIDRSIKDYDKVVVICSENSLQSGPVLREIERALQREDREGKNILLPIRIDDYIFDRWEHPRKADVVSKVVGDFRGWEQDADKYEAAFTKLLEALEAEG
jgi:hypothetical protein